MTQKPSKKKRIVSSDLDMTLLNHKTWEIPDSAMKALELLRKDSVITIRSGRNMNYDMGVVYQDMIMPDAVIHINGTRVVAEGNVLFEHLMDKERLRALLEYGGAHGIFLGVSQEGKDYYIHPEGAVRMDRLRWGVSERNFMDGWELLNMPARTLVYIGGPKGTRGLEAHFPEFKFPMLSGNMGAGVVEQEVSKAEGLKRLCQYCDIGLEQTAAFGDGMNDYEIVREAGIGIVMGNSVEGLKAVADYVANDIGRDGVWKACRHLRLI